MHFNNSLFFFLAHPAPEMKARAKARVLSNWNENLSPFRAKAELNMPLCHVLGGN